MCINFFIIDKPGDCGVTTERFLTDIRAVAPQRRIIVHFWANWSIPALIQQKELLSVLNIYPETSLFRVNSDTFMSVLDNLRISSVPTVILDVAGQSVAVLPGLVRAIELTSCIKGSLSALHQFSSYEESASTNFCAAELQKSLKSAINRLRAGDFETGVAICNEIASFNAGTLSDIARELVANVKVCRESNSRLTPM